MQVTYESRHNHPIEEDFNIINHDIEVFNNAKMSAVNRLLHGESVSHMDGVDRRTKEGRELAKQEPESLYMQIKHEYGINDYFTTSTIREANSAIKSVNALNGIRQDEVSSKIKQIKKKIKKTEKRLNGLIKMKESCIRYSNALKHGKKLPKIKGTPVERYNSETGSFEILYFGKKVRSFENMYLFEIRYLDPKIKELKSRIRNLKCRLEHHQKILKKLRKEWPHICFGSKKLFRKQNTNYAGDHETWRKTWHKRRHRVMTISGRADATQGNFVVRYDTNTHTLTYRAMNGKPISFDCEFPYGQKEIDDAINVENGWTKQAIAWSLEISGHSVIVKCILTRKEINRNEAYSDGVVAFDTNYVCLAVTETDCNGNPINHFIIAFDLEKKSSQQIEHILSAALDRVYEYAEQVGKPVVMEDLKIKQKTELYSSRKRNRNSIT